MRHFNSPQTQQTTWPPSDWELSQFELKDGWLKPAPVTNTPWKAANTAPNLLFQSVPYIAFIDSSTRAMMDWLFGNKVQVLQGNHFLPLNYSYGGYEFKLAATGVIDAEQVHYWDLNWQTASTDHYTQINTALTGYDEEKDVRHQFSLNTCQGCHSGETKTLFTMVRPSGYGEEINYWTNTDTPSYDRGPIDTRFMFNIGSSYNINGSNVVNNYRILTDSSDQATTYLPRVSAFITGRTFFGDGSYQDDRVDLVEDIQDSIFSNLPSFFYVFEPTNYNDGNAEYTVPKSERFSRFNELDRRYQDICSFVSMGCTPPKVIAVLHNVRHIPLPRGSH